MVIDIYDLDNPVHPEGHVGWWKFRLDGAPASISGTLAIGPDGLLPRLNGRGADGSWRNGEMSDRRLYLLMSVLRSNVTNAIAHIDQIPAATNNEALADLRSRASFDWRTPRFETVAAPPRPDGCVHIVAPEIRTRDAVGNLCLDLYRLLRQNDVPVRLYADGADLSLNNVIEPKSDLAGAVGPQDHIVYFYSTDDPTISAVTGIACARKTAYYHGVTNPRLLRVFDPEGSAACERAIEAMESLRGFDRLAANSAANADILARAVGRDRRADIRVVPPALVVWHPPAQPTGSRESALLFVGQIKPHKKVEDLLRLFADYRRTVPSAQCWIVGATRIKAYRDYLAWVQTEELKLPPDSVRWLGSVSDTELASLYRRAAAYVSMSEDEGFCVPLFEAMRHGLPVFAFDVPAVSEMRGGAGTGFSAKDPARLSGEIKHLLADPVRLAQVIDRQFERAGELAATMTGSAFLELIAPD